MELSQYVETLQGDLRRSAAAAGESAEALAGLLAAALEPAARLALMEAISAAVAEVAAAVDGVQIDVRLAGREPQISVTPAERSPGPTPPSDADTARITLRLPDPVKTRVERRAAELGVSVNTWLVRAVTAALQTESGRRRHGPGTTLRGYVRG